MPEIQIDGTGTKLAYLDSGIPKLIDRPYTTLVIVHGFVFNNPEKGCFLSDIFHKLLPIATASHIRLILVNRRGYHGSTPLADSDTDTSTLSESDKLDFYTNYLQIRAKELSTFLVKLIENENLPLKVETPGRASGGINLIGWSLGNVTTLSVLAFANTLDPGMVHKLDEYLRTFVIYDAPHHVLGYPTPPGCHDPFYDPDIPDAEREARFAVWVSAYFTHDPALFDNKLPISELTNGILEQRNGNPAKPPTLTRLTPEDAAKCIEAMTSSAHGDQFMLDVKNLSVHRKVLVKALFGHDGTLALSNTKVVNIWCTEAFWEVAYGARLLQAEIESSSQVSRAVKFIPFEGANHYGHYDDPLTTLAIFAKAMEYR
ncbi:hypothetical protein Clacol_006919 [Clathrus columnatus]|uniref:AB hydrolase-1 domain-containing protein n=1 Tax=Clathrus columnatus TaxID=1419009 RepID=A0AAV5AEJ7_9AGAM|nr:hypothetical protein Clacol_006919 [Clathrus columnatus]